MSESEDRPDLPIVSDSADADIPVADSDTAESTGSHQSLSAELRGLIDDLQTTVESELEFHRTRISYTINQSKHISALMVGVGIFGSVAVMALVLGLLLALIPLVGNWIAIAIVTLTCILLALLCFGFAAWKARRLQNLYRGEDEDKQS
ncbi:phage holin family protein [Sphingorhabdus sp. Alg239-R122]|uniref:phage holin family protein n=1 Tax=Sphingorhabdus sp. Alg239-R122 TaxID=2305989 RepID=UPI0013D936EA|nr:phage holin family protein [Sphingorhabdus sp. Alg239-R122]